jgi:hypothetical protein
MKWTIDHSNLPVYLRVNVEGKPTVESNRALWDEILKSEAWTPGTSVLFDSGRLEPLGPEANHLTQESVRYFIEYADEIGPSCIAVFRARPETYSYSRQFQYAIRLRGSAVIVRRFSDEQAAIDWLNILSGNFESKKP